MAPLTSFPTNRLGERLPPIRCAGVPDVLTATTVRHDDAPSGHATHPAGTALDDANGATRAG
jgi:hypothetical protein